MNTLFGLLCFLLSLGLLLALVTVVGHGLWLLVAAIFRPASARREQLRYAPPRLHKTCSGCGEPFSFLDAERCPECGLDPESEAADELRDLEAARRALQRLRETGLLAAELNERVHACMDDRRLDLLEQRRPRARTEAEAALDVLTQLEVWFDDDFGARLSVAEKKQALALTRSLSNADLKDLSPRALVGIARLQSAVGMLSRACQMYQTLFACHPHAPLSREVAVEALRCVCKLEDWPRVNEVIEAVRALAPDLAEQQPELADLMRQVRERSPVVVPALPTPSALPKPRATPPPLPVEAAAPIVLSTPAPVRQTAAQSVVPTPRRRSFAEWIAVFMEESNILWGELIGGTLIVGCSIALVISLWQTLGDIPFFPFLIFAAITSALFGAGFYTLHHWKLESTSRGLLLIGTLLVPLNFLVLSVLSREEGAGVIEYVAEIASLLVFGFFLQRAARILVQQPLAVPIPSAWLLTFSMLASAAAQLCAQHWMGPIEEGRWLPYVFTVLPVLALLVALGWILHTLRREETWNLSRRVALLLTLGSAAFACSVTLCFLLYVADDLALMTPTLSLALTLLGLPILISGILIYQKSAILPQENNVAQEQRGLWYTLGTGLALLGLFVMFGGFAVAAEQPPLRWLSGLLNIGALLACAWVLRVPVLHVPAQVYLAVLIVVGWALPIDDWMQRSSAALRLSGLLVVQALFAEALMRLRRPRDARYYALGTGVSTLLALLLTVWFGRGEPGVAALVCAVAAVTWFAVNLRWRSAEITYACSFVLAGAIFAAVRALDAETPLTQQLLWSLLAHATACLLASVPMRFAPSLQNFFRVPLQFASLAASGLVVALVGMEQFHATPPWTISAGACSWLALLWLVLSLLEGWPMLFAGVQTALACAWFFGASAWLTAHGWDWLEPYSIHVYAVGLALQCLVWEVLRLNLTPSRWRVLLAPSFVPIDRCLACVLLLGQYVLLVWLVLFGIGRELSATPEDWRLFPALWYAHASAPAAWLLPLVLAGVLALWLRSVDFRLPLLGGMVLLLTFPLLAALGFDEQKAVASALRWGLALGYGFGSLLLWNRERLDAERSERVPLVPLRIMLNVGALMPVLLISALVVAKKLAHQTLPGPLADSIFSAIGGPVSLLVPVALLSITLAGHGLRERLAHYLLAAGWLATLGAVGGYFLALQRMQIPFGESWVAVDALLIASGTLWFCSIAWTWWASQQPAEEARSLLRSPFLMANNELGHCLYGFVCLFALVGIVFLDRPDSRDLIQSAGSVGSWLVFLLIAGGTLFFLWQRHGSLPLYALGGAGLIAVFLSACTLEIFFPQHSFVVLMFGAGLFACVWVWLTMLIDPERAPRWLRCSHDLRESPAFASLAGGLALFMGCATLFSDQQPIWSAEAVVLAGAAFALLAYQRKRERWASLASGAAVLASIILVTHLRQGQRLLWLDVVQVVLATLGGTALLQLALQRYLTRPQIVRSPRALLTTQIALGMIGNLVLLVLPGIPVVLAMDQLPRDVRVLASVAGWLALVLNATAAIWYAGLIRPQTVLHLVGLSGWLLGLMATYSACYLVDPLPLWIALQIAMTVWLLLATLLVVLSWLGHSQPILGPRSWPMEQRIRCTDFFRACFPAAPTRAWVSFVGSCVVLLALHAELNGMEKPLFFVPHLLTVSVLFGVLAIWSRSSIYVFGSGLLFNLIGLLLYSAWRLPHRPLLGADTAGELLVAQILSFAVAALVWSLVEYRLSRVNIDLSLALPFPFTQFALGSGTFLAAVSLVVATTLKLGGEQIRLQSGLFSFAWVALAALSAASLLELWRPAWQRAARVHLYLHGLVALGLILLGQDLSLSSWWWSATLLLAGYVLLIVVLRRVVDASPRLQGMLQPETDSAWFWQLQLGTLGLVLLLSFWITLSFATWTDRLGGALATALVTVAAFFLVPVWPRLFLRSGEATISPVPYYLVLSLKLAFALELCWSLLDPEMASIWLQRSAVLFTMATMMALAYRFLVPRLLAPSFWTESARTFSMILSAISALLLVLFFLQELGSYSDVLRTTPLHKGLVLASGLALLGLIGFTLYSALTKEADPYGVEKGWRSSYVYAAELLTLLLLMHVRLNVPDFIPPVFGQYGFLAVMVLAFAALGLSEIFARKELPILAVPLKRTALLLAFLPVIAFRLKGLTELRHLIGNGVAGLQPFLRFLDRLPDDYRMEALCWLLLGIFFGWLASLRRSANYGIFAALAVNFAVWVLLGHQDATTFLLRPQLWLIPLGLIILVAESINRDRLGFWPSLSIRYVGLWCIYLSSTIEMFREGLGNSVLLPLVLVLLAVSGMLLGILFRVRAFLLSGFLALLVVVFAQIWNAAVGHGQTWIWWVCGIILGVAILCLFALFEKHRNEVLKMLDSMKRWS